MNRIGADWSSYNREKKRGRIFLRERNFAAENMGLGVCALYDRSKVIGQDADLGVSPYLWSRELTNRSQTTIPCIPLNSEVFTS